MRILLATLFLALATLNSAALESPDLEHFDQLWNYGDPAGTEVKFRNLLPAAEESDIPGLLAQLQSQIARCQGLQGQFEEAHATLDLAETHLTPTTHLAQTRILLERGRVLNSSGDPTGSIPLFLEALEMAKSNDLPFHMVDTAHMLGIVESSDRALEWNLKAIKMAEETADERARWWLGPLYNNTGWTLHDLGKYEQALAIFKKSYDYRLARKQVVPTRIAKYTVARALRSLERYQEALDMQREIQAEIEASDSQADGFVFEEIGENLLALGRSKEARPWFGKAWVLLSEVNWMVQSEGERLARMKELAGENTR